MSTQSNTPPPIQNGGTNGGATSAPYYGQTQAFGSNQGARPVAQIVHSTCQYTQQETIMRTDNTTYDKVVPCPNVAVFNPGYKRACATHVPHILKETIHEYVRRYDNVHLEDTELATRYAHECSTLLALAAQLDTIISPPPPKRRTARPTRPDDA